MQNIAQLSYILSTIFPDLLVHTLIIEFCGLQIKVEHLQVNIAQAEGEWGICIQFSAQPQTSCTVLNMLFGPYCRGNWALLCLDFRQCVW